MGTTGKRVLIAEDNETSRLILQSLLAKWGYEVVATRDGAEAWAVLQSENPPRLAIMDWMMPEMDGAEVCRRLREVSAGQPFYVIILTALGRKEDIVSGLEAGADDYLTKPFNREELRARLQVGERVIALQTALAQRAQELEEAIAHIRTLQGILPICMHCHRIRNDEQSWQKVEHYIEAHSNAQFSHGLCPECLEKYYPE